jgi:hypothetical protein
MLDNYLPQSDSFSKERSVTIVDVLPARLPERCSCSYCGKEKRVAYRFVADNGREAVTCYPCSDQGMNWLEQNFPHPVHH